MDPLDTNMYHLKRHHPSDSFCTFISESAVCKSFKNRPATRFQVISHQFRTAPGKCDHKGASDAKSIVQYIVKCDV